MAPGNGWTINHGEIPTSNNPLYETSFVSQAASLPVNRAERRLYRFRGCSDEARKLRTRTVLTQSLESYLDLD